ncbi:MAG: hypothetical protein H0X30_11985 [Anaerolineae bacterium]|nr:hypothetical protein [Anaerolineae bacterium]
MRFGRSAWQGITTLSGLMLLSLTLVSHSVSAQTPEWTAEPTTGWAAEATPAVAAAAPQLKLVWQTKFSGETALFSPGDVAIDSLGNSYVSTQSGNSVIKFDKDGKFVMKWGDSGKDEGKFNLSFGVTVDANDNVFITDFYNHRIQKFDSDGKFLMEWKNEKSTSPAFIGIDAKGNIYVDEFPPHDDHYIQKFDSGGTLLSEWSGDSGKFGGRIEDIAVDQAGNVFVADPFTNKIKKMDTAGKLVAAFGGDASNNGNGLFYSPFGVAVDGKGFVYTLDRNFLQKLDADGKFVAQWSTAGGDLDKASNVTADSEGNIYVFAKSDVTTADGTKVNVFLLKKFSQSDSGW